MIDTNRLESSELRRFLAASAVNKAVLPEHTLTEMFKPKSLDAIYANHSVIIDFPTQIIVLQGNRKLRKVDARAPGVANRFIDRKMTKGFPIYCKLLRIAMAGDAEIQGQIQERHAWALERASVMSEVIDDQSEALRGIRSEFDPDDLRQLAAGLPTSYRFKALILGGATALATTLAQQLSDGVRLSKPPHRYNSFIWRYSLCHLVQLISLLARGGTRRRRDKAVNDHFDNVFATFGTYYNGLMTMDRDSLSTYAVARTILDGLGARLAPDYLETGYDIALLDRETCAANAD
ncbi:hypothetical protein [Sphingomonas sp. Leaf343]|uniref:hypothetical protein n=1 Tax=Sphingomonas sp. Leaf343 TaxID=1736345 RepID=UPI0012E2F2AD|nr:hypothetical protein [Sphingomonas sp. Leaf343]